MAREKVYAVTVTKHGKRGTEDQVLTFNILAPANGDYALVDIHAAMQDILKTKNRYKINDIKDLCIVTRRGIRKKLPVERVMRELMTMELPDRPISMREARDAVYLSTSVYQRPSRSTTWRALNALCEAGDWEITQDGKLGGIKSERSTLYRRLRVWEEWDEGDEE